MCIACFERAARGLHVMDPTRKHVVAMLGEMLKLRGPRRIAVFLALLGTLAQSRRCRTIASPGFTASPTSHEEQRIGRICQFIDENYHRRLRMAEMAKLIHMSEGALSRFFRSHMGKTFPAFLNDLRIGRACRLLAETEMNVTEVALSCGYRNISNFNRQFQPAEAGFPPPVPPANAGGPLRAHPFSSRPVRMRWHALSAAKGVGRRSSRPSLRSGRATRLAKLFLPRH